MIKDVLKTDTLVWTIKMFSKFLTICPNNKLVVRTGVQMFGQYINVTSRVLVSRRDVACQECYTMVINLLFV